MPTMSVESMTAAMLELVKHNTTPCGMVRIGNFSSPDSRGNSLVELGYMQEGAFIISYSNAGILTEVFCAIKHKPIAIKYEIIHRDNSTLKV